jgi:subtilase family serine protease
VDLSAQLDVTVVLRRDDATQAAFEKLLAAQQDTASPLFRQWLTPSQLGTMFGVAPADLQAVTGWLESQGLQVTRVEPNGVLLDVSGSVAAVSGAFGTNFGQFKVGTEIRLSAIEEPSVPAALQGVIAGVHGLSQSSLHAQAHARTVQGEARANTTGARPMLTTSGGAHYVSPKDFATIYNLNPLYSAGNTGATVAGKAQRIAIVGRSRVDADDIAQFENMSGLPNAQPTVIIPTGGTDPGTTKDGNQDEATLDVTRALGTAPGAGVDLVVSSDSKNISGVYLATAYAVNTLVDPILSISFGDCERNAGAQGVAAWDTLFSAAAAEGITVLVSSGDSGAAGCDADSNTLPVTQVASINYICASSYATCVGGTQFADAANAGSYWSTQNGPNDSSALSYIPEGAWNEPTAGSGSQISYVASGTGGGASQYVGKPGWQTGVGVPTDGQRDVPDLSLNSAEHNGYVACLSYAGGNCANGSFEVFGGTSAAAPGMAGIVALLNTATGSPAGNLNPLLYRLAADRTNGVFHDVTVETSGVSGCTLSVPSLCNNSTPSASGLTGGLSGFQVASGYDQATGWGSVDATRLVTVAANGSGSSGKGAASASFTLAPLTGSLTVSAGSLSGNATAVTVAGANGFAGTVALTCNVALANGGTAALPPSCAISPGTVNLSSTSATSASASVAIDTHGVSGSTCTPGSTTANVRVSGVLLASLCLLLVPAAGRRKLRGLTVLVVGLAGVSLMTGCGGTAGTTVTSSCSAQTTTTPTTAGSYVITVTGVSGSTSASTSFSLNVK